MKTRNKAKAAKPSFWDVWGERLPWYPEDGKPASAEREWWLIFEDHPEAGIVGGGPTPIEDEYTSQTFRRGLETLWPVVLRRDWKARANNYSDAARAIEAAAREAAMQQKNAVIAQRYEDVADAALVLVERLKVDKLLPNGCPLAYSWKAIIASERLLRRVYSLGPPPETGINIDEDTTCRCIARIVKARRRIHVGDFGRDPGLHTLVEREDGAAKTKRNACIRLLVAAGRMHREGRYVVHDEPQA